MNGKECLEARFEKPVDLDLIESVKKMKYVDPDKIGIWAHEVMVARLLYFAPSIEQLRRFPTTGTSLPEPAQHQPRARPPLRHV